MNAELVDVRPKWRIALNMDAIIGPLACLVELDDVDSDPRSDQQRQFDEIGVGGS